MTEKSVFPADDFVLTLRRNQVKNLTELRLCLSVTPDSRFLPTRSVHVTANNVSGAETSRAYRQWYRNTGLSPRKSDGGTLLCTRSQNWGSGSLLWDPQILIQTVHVWDHQLEKSVSPHTATPTLRLWNRDNTESVHSYNHVLSCFVQAFCHD